MKNNKDKITESLRSQQRAKRRKTNLILNSLIGVVLLLIVIVSVTIFGKDDRSPEQTVANTVNEESDTDDQKSKASDQVEKKSSDAKEENTKEKDLNKEDNQDEEEVIDGETEIDDEQVVGSNPEWEPVGTTQIEPAQDYDRNGVDWNEQLQAVSHATGFDQSKGDTLVRLGNNGPKKSKATVVIKETNTKYQVYIEWTDGEGWKPVLVEEVTN